MNVLTSYAGPDAVLCTLENSFTPAEQSLVRMGEHQRLRDMRMFLQYATEKEFRETVAQIMGRKVRLSSAARTSSRTSPPSSTTSTRRD